MKNKNITTHDEMKDTIFGVMGTTTRDEYEVGYKKFKQKVSNCFKRKYV